MTIIKAPSTDPHIAPAWLRRLTATKTYYEEALSWPVLVDIEPHRILIPAGDVLDAITMPARLAQAVVAELRIEMLAGPVISQTSGQWWTFLTELTLAPQPGISIDLRGLRVNLVPYGNQIVLPNQIGDAATPLWSERPRRRHCLTPWSAIVGTARRVAARPSTVPTHKPTIDHTAPSLPDHHEHGTEHWPLTAEPDPNNPLCPR
jgi:hypothetical protein